MAHTSRSLWTLHRGLRAVTARAVAGFVMLAAVACSQPAPPPAPAAAPAPAPAGPRIYVSDETGGNVFAIDPVAGTVVDRIAVGKRPRGIKISKDGTQLFVALSGSPIGGPGVDDSKLPPADRSADGIGIVDLATHKVLRVLKSGQDPESFDLTPDGSTLIVSNEDASEATFLDLASGEVKTRVKVGGEPEGVTVRPDGKEVYVTSEADNAVFAIDVATHKVAGKMTTAARPRGVVFTSDGKTAFVTSENGGAVAVIDTATHKVATTIVLPKAATPPTPPKTVMRPMGAVLSPDGKQVFVSFGRAASVGVIDVATRKLVKTIEDVGARPWGIGISSDGTRLYTANGPSGDVAVIDLASGTVTKRISTGGSPWGVAVK